MDDGDAAILAAAGASRPEGGARPSSPLTWRGMLRPAFVRRAVLGVAALWLFVVAIRTLSRGAGGIEPLLDALGVSNPVNALGFAWFGAYAVLSGSPIAERGSTRNSTPRSSSRTATGSCATRDRATAPTSTAKRSPSTS